MAKVVLGLLLLFGLSIPVTSTTASPEVVKWSWVNIPTDGEIGGWVLAEGSDVRHLTAAIDGTLRVGNRPNNSYQSY